MVIELFYVVITLVLDFVMLNLLCLAILFCVILFFVFVSPIYEFAADKLYQQVYKLAH